MRAATICLIILYPLTTHFSVAIGDPNPSLFLMLLGVLLVSTGLFLNHKYKASAYVLFGTMGVYFAAYFIFSDHFKILFIPPLLVSLFLLWLFGRSLAPGRMALISKMATAYHGELPPPVVLYTRRVTIMWTIYFAVFAISVFYLGFISPSTSGSFYINLFNYLVITLLLGGEYLIRVYRFKDLQHPSFIGFLRLLNNSGLYLHSHHR